MSRWPVLALSLLACAPADPRPIHRDLRAARVLTAGVCTGATYSTVQDAIDAALDGDVVEVCPGSYAEQLEITTKALTLRSTDGAAVTEIDGQGLGKTLVVRDGAAVLVEGLTFTNGDAGSDGRGGNVYCRSSTLDLRDSVLRDGFAYEGGGLGTRECWGIAQGNTFEGNTAERGGGAYFDGELTVFDLVGNTVRFNTATGQGGGTFFYDGLPLIDGNTFEGNWAEAQGGGLRIKIAEAIVTNNVFLANGAGTYGGALKISHDEATLTGNTYVGNTAGSGGGASYLFESASLLVGEVYDGNDGGRKGGAVFVTEGWGGPVFEDCTFSGNSATRGGHLYLDLQDETTVLRRVRLLDGDANLGGALYALQSPFELENTLVEGNVGTFSGGGLYVDGSTGVVTNSVLIGNRASTGAALTVTRGVAGLDVANTVFAENLVGAAVAVVSGTAPMLRYDDFHQNASDFSGMSSVLGTNGNVSVAPGFVDPAAGDYALQATSGLVDAGDPAILDVDGTRSDIGLFGGPSAY